MRRNSALKIVHGVSLVRILAAVLFGAVAFQPLSTGVIASIYLIAVFSDPLDGFLARRLNVQSPFGRILDLIADKVLTLVSALYAAERGVPFFPLALIASREILMLGARLVVVDGETLFQTNRLLGGLVCLSLWGATFSIIAYPQQPTVASVCNWVYWMCAIILNASLLWRVYLNRDRIAAAIELDSHIPREHTIVRGVVTGELRGASQDDKDRYPSKAHGDAIASPLSRMSELMFGSLLIGYLFGFVGVVSSAIVRAGLPAAAKARIVAECTSVSLAYAYLTAGTYLTYHAGILTMFHWPLERLRWDFAITLSTALSFGVALLVPESFPLMMAGALFCTIGRQRYETSQFAAALWEYTHPQDASVRRKVSSDQIKEVHKCLQKTEYSELSGWRRPDWQFTSLTTALLFVGTVMLIWTDGRLLKWPAVLQQGLMMLPSPEWAIAVVNGVAATVLVMYAHRKPLPRRAQSLSSMATDQQFQHLLAELRKQRG